MKAFVAFGYNERDAWIPEIIFPILNCLEIEIVTGEDLEGVVLSAGVIDKIKESDAVLAFCTKRDKIAENKWGTHPWILQEIASGLTQQKKILALFELEVDSSQVAILQGHQIVHYDNAKREELIVSLIKTLSRWKKEASRKKIKLLPEEMIIQLKGAFNQNQVECHYNFMVDGDELEKIKTTPIRLSGGYIIQIKNIPMKGDIFLNVRLQGPGNEIWETGYEPFEYMALNFQKI